MIHKGKCFIFITAHGEIKLNKVLQIQKSSQTQYCLTFSCEEGEKTEFRDHNKVFHCLSCSDLGKSFESSYRYLGLERREIHFDLCQQEEIDRWWQILNRIKDDLNEVQGNYAYHTGQSVFEHNYTHVYSAKLFPLEGDGFMNKPIKVKKNGQTKSIEFKYNEKTIKQFICKYKEGTLELNEEVLLVITPSKKVEISLTELIEDILPKIRIYAFTFTNERGDTQTEIVEITCAYNENGETNEEQFRNDYGFEDPEWRYVEIALPHDSTIISASCRSFESPTAETCNVMTGEIIDETQFIDIPSNKNSQEVAIDSALTTSEDLSPLLGGCEG